MAQIGFTTMFAYRPHVEMMYFLSQQFKSLGHIPHHLVCPGFIGNCHSKLTRPSSFSDKECLKCMGGSLYTYTSENVTFLNRDQKSKLSQDRLKKMVESSCYTAFRIEDPSDQTSDDIEKMKESLFDSVSIVYENTVRWIKENNLEYVFFFNGRMDLTRAVMEACKDTGVKFSSIERTVFGHGIQANLFNNCLSLDLLHEVVQDFKDKPLTQRQAQIAASLIAPRFRNQKNFEWRNYNLNERKVSWPVQDTGKKILILPSSTNESMGHHDWSNDWQEFTKTFEDLIKKLGVNPKNVVLRSHPVWAQNIGKFGGEKITKYYRDWCLKSGVYFLEPNDSASSRSLMLESDLIILTGSSAAFEASLLGKPTLCVKKCHYLHAGISKFVLNSNDLNDLDVESLFNPNSKELIRKVLRYLYAYGVRYSLFFDDAKSVSTTKYVYRQKVEVHKLLEMLDSKKFVPSDTSFSSTTEDEDQIVELIYKNDWSTIDYGHLYSPGTDFFTPSRRGIFKLVNYLRDQLPRGDQ